MTRALVVFATVFVVVFAPLAAQTPVEVEAEPIVKLQPGETLAYIGPLMGFPASSRETASRNRSSRIAR